MKQLTEEEIKIIELNKVEQEKMFEELDNAVKNMKEYEVINND